MAYSTHEIINFSMDIQIPKLLPKLHFSQLIQCLIGSNLTCSKISYTVICFNFFDSFFLCQILKYGKYENFVTYINVQMKAHAFLWYNMKI